MLTRRASRASPEAGDFADARKRNRTLVAVDGRTGALQCLCEIAASDASALGALRSAAGLQDERVWALAVVRDGIESSPWLSPTPQAVEIRVLRITAIRSSVSAHG